MSLNRHMRLGMLRYQKRKQRSAKYVSSFSLDSTYRAILPNFDFIPLVLN